MGHPLPEEIIVVISKHPKVHADTFALFYRPWLFYSGLLLASDYGAIHKLLFSSGYLITTPGETIDRLRSVNVMTGTPGLPRIADQHTEELIERDTPTLLGID